MQRCVLRNVGTMFCAGSLPCKSIFTNFHEENLMKQVVLNASLAFFAGSGLPGRISVRREAARTAFLSSDRAERPAKLPQPQKAARCRPRASSGAEVSRDAGHALWTRNSLTLLTLLNELRTPQMPHKHLIPHTHRQGRRREAPIASPHTVRQIAAHGCGWSFRLFPAVFGPFPDRFRFVFRSLYVARFQMQYAGKGFC